MRINELKSEINATDDNNVLSYLANGLVKGTVIEFIIIAISYNNREVFTKFPDSIEDRERVVSFVVQENCENNEYYGIFIDNYRGFAICEGWLSFVINNTFGADYGLKPIGILRPHEKPFIDEFDIMDVSIERIYLVADDNSESVYDYWYKKLLEKPENSFKRFCFARTREQCDFEKIESIHENVKSISKQLKDMKRQNRITILLLLTTIAMLLLVLVL